MKPRIIRLLKILVVLGSISFLMVFLYPISFSILGLDIYPTVINIFFGAFFFFGVLMIILILVFGDGLMQALEKWRTVQIAHSFDDFSSVLKTTARLETKKYVLEKLDCEFGTVYTYKKRRFMTTEIWLMIDAEQPIDFSEFHRFFPVLLNRLKTKFRSVNVITLFCTKQAEVISDKVLLSYNQQGIEFGSLFLVLNTEDKTITLSQVKDGMGIARQRKLIKRFKKVFLE